MISEFVLSLAHHHPTDTIISPLTAFRTNITFIKLPREVWICLVSQHLADQPGVSRKCLRLLENLFRTDGNLTPPLLKQCLNARPINALLE